MSVGERRLDFAVVLSERTQMRSLLGMLSVASLHLTLGCGGVASAPSPIPSPSTPVAQPSAPGIKAAGEATIGDRTHCPTSGEEFVVTADSPKFEYKGKTYYFCCSGCDKKFASDPEKYITKKPDA